MDNQTVLARIISGETLLEYKDTIYVHKMPSRSIRNQAELVYKRALARAEQEDMINEKTLLEILFVANLWTPDDETKLKNFQTDLENTKLKAFEERKKTNVLKEARRIIETANENIITLLNNRHQYDFLTDVYYARCCKQRFLFCKSLSCDETPLIQNESLPIEDLISVYNISRVDDTFIRALALNDEWQSFWASKKYCGRGLFDVASVDLTDEQRSIIGWSQFYDSLRECSDLPDGIIEDHDLLDGWLISQRKKREVENKKRNVQSRISPSIAGNDEVYIANNYVDDELMLVEEPIEETVEQIKLLSSEFEQGIKKQRSQALEKHGQLTEINMPDAKLRALSKNG
jgi:hypothetical protein